MKDKIQEELEKEIEKLNKSSKIGFWNGLEIRDSELFNKWLKVITCEAKLAQHKQTKEEMIKEFEKMLLDEHNSREDIIKKLGEIK